MKAVFAIPGDMHRKTGGFIYEAELWAALNRIGCETAHLELPDSFPVPTPQDMATTLAALGVVPAGVPIILDGFVSGTIDPRGLSQLAAPVIAITHHPLGHETGLAPDRAAMLVAKERAALAKVAHVVVPSPHTAATLQSHFGVERRRISVAPPGFVKPRGFHPVPETPPLVLSVGLLAPRKGHDVLLAALAAVDDLPWRAEIIGRQHDAATARALHAQCAALSLGARVAFLGEVEDAVLEARLAAASIFALATHYEGYGMVFGEAMLRGLPIVSCAAGAVPDTVGGAGILVPPGNAAAFGVALRRMLAEPETRAAYARTSARQGADLPTWDDTARIVAGVIGALT
ncbi:MAG TPA: glycosyltransferase family 4 protein [Roseovarius sp.]